MPVSFPHIGSFTYVMESIIKEMNRNDILLPSKPTNKTKLLGASHSPEFICTPFKMLLGSLIEVLDRGATELIEPGFVAFCRFGYYFPVHKLILEDLGFEFEFINMNYEKPIDILKAIKEYGNNLNYISAIRALQIGWVKNRFIDVVDKLLCRYRAIELTKGTTKHLADKMYRLIVETRGLKDIKRLGKNIPDIFAKEIEIDRSMNPLKVGLVGELYAVLEPAINLDVMRRLNELGVIVYSPISFTRWIDVGEKLNLFKKQHHKIAIKKAKPYVEFRLGGETQESIGSSIMFKEKNWDGVIHLYPLTCMPEIISRSILPQISKEYDIPIVSLVLDEHTGEAGLQTRLEAFVDLMQYKRREFIN